MWGWRPCRPWAHPRGEGVPSVSSQYRGRERHCMGDPPTLWKGTVRRKGHHLPRRESPGPDLWAECPEVWDPEAAQTRGQEGGWERWSETAARAGRGASRRPRSRGGKKEPATCLALGAPLTGCGNVGGRPWGSERGNSRAGGTARRRGSGHPTHLATPCPPSSRKPVQQVSRLRICSGLRGPTVTPRAPALVEKR